MQQKNSVENFRQKRFYLTKQTFDWFNQKVQLIRSSYLKDLFARVQTRIPL